MTTYPNQQNNPAAAIPVWNAGGSFVNIPTSVRQQIKVGAGVLSAVGVNAGGTASTVAMYDGISAVVTITIANPGVVSWPAHGFVAGNAVQFTTSDTLPTGIVSGTTYYVSSAGLAAGSFRIADTRAHAIAGTNSVVTSVGQAGVQTGWDANAPIGTYDTTAVGQIPVGAMFSKGLFSVAADGGGAANLTIIYR